MGNLPVQPLIRADHWLPSLPFRTLRPPPPSRKIPISGITIKAGRDAGAEEILMVLRRGEETIEIKLKRGQIGIRAAEKYNEPVFE